MTARLLLALLLASTAPAAALTGVWDITEDIAGVVGWLMEDGVEPLRWHCR